MQGGGRFIRTDIWREGKYLDLWSVPHVLSGMAVALSLYILDFRGISAYTIAFLIFVVYEMFEVIAKIEETRMNRMLDVVVGIVSFSPIYILAPHFSYYELIVAFAGITVVDGVLSFFGWRESQKAAVLEEKVRQEFHVEREKMRMRRERMRQGFQLQKTRMRKRWYARREKGASNVVK